MPDRPQKITFAEMRDMGVRGLLIYFPDYKCSHLIEMSGDRWLSDLEPRLSSGGAGRDFRAGIERGWLAVAARERDIREVYRRRPGIVCLNKGTFISPGA
jgi:hypothetical protein